MTVANTLGISLAAVLVAANPAVAAESAAVDAVKNIVLVHGANTDGSGWRGVYDILKKDGFHVSVVQEPLTGLSASTPSPPTPSCHPDGTRKRPPTRLRASSGFWRSVGTNSQPCKSSTG